MSFFFCLLNVSSYLLLYVYYCFPHLLSILAHVYYCSDNVDTRSTLDAMRDLVGSSYEYLERRRTASAAVPNRVLLKNAAVYVTGILKVRHLILTRIGGILKVVYSNTQKYSK